MWKVGVAEYRYKTPRKLINSLKNEAIYGCGDTERPHFLVKALG
jgi:hypothetical protein